MQRKESQKYKRLRRLKFQSLETRWMLAAEMEPNDSIATARVFNHSGWLMLEGEIAGAADVDLWAADLQSGDTIDVYPSDDDFFPYDAGEFQYGPGIEITDPSGNVLDVSRDGHTLRIQAAESGRHFLRMSSDSVFGPMIGGYNVGVYGEAFFRGRSESEPNSSPSSATFLGSGDLFRGSFASSSDVDVFRITVTQGDAIAVRLNGAASRAPRTRILDGAGNVVGQASGDPGLHAFADSSGDYFLELRRGQADEYSGSILVGSAAVQSDPAATTFDAAQPLSLDEIQTVAGTFWEIGQQRVFQVELSALDRPLFQFLGPQSTSEGSGRVIELSNRFGQVLNFTTTGLLDGEDSFSQTVQPGLTGTHFVSIRATNASGLGGFLLRAGLRKPFPAHRDIPQFFHDYTDQVVHNRHFPHDVAVTPFTATETIDALNAAFKGARGEYEFDLTNNYPGDGAEYVGYGVQDFQERQGGGGSGENYGGVRQLVGDSILDDAGTHPVFNSFSGLFQGGVFGSMLHEIAHAVGSPHGRDVLDVTAYDGQWLGGLQTIGSGTFHPFTDSRIPSTSIRNERDAWDWGLQAGRIVAEQEPNDAADTGLVIAGYLIEMQLEMESSSYATESSDPSRAPIQTKLADFNNDGLLDLASASMQDNNVAVFLNTGGGNFRLRTYIGADGIDGTSKPIAIADFDGDGQQDVAVLGHGSNLVRINSGLGDGTFTSAGVQFTSADPTAIAADDINGDGAADLVVINASGSLQTFLGSGANTFAAGPTAALPSEGVDVQLLDVNDDGLKDVLGISRDSPNVTVLLNQSGTSFVAPIRIHVGDNLTAIGAADTDGDGKLDLLATNIVSDDLRLPRTQLTVFRGLGDGRFDQIDAKQFPIRSESFDIADVNGDGRLDVALADFSGEVHFLLGDDSGTFSDPIRFSVNGGIYADNRGVGESETVSLTLGDLNNDGRTDAVTSNRRENRVGVLIGEANDSRNDRVVITGQIDSASDVDIARIEVSANQRWLFDVEAAEFQYPLNSLLEVRDAQGNLVAFNDDAVDRTSGLESTDPFIDHVFASAGQYTVAVRGKAGSVGAYRLKLTPDSALSTRGVRVLASIPDGGGQIGSAGQIRLFLDGLLDPASLTPANVRVVGDTTGPQSGTAFFDPLDATLTWTSDQSLPSDRFTLTLAGGADGVTDLLGTPIDGESGGLLSFPDVSGNGAAGGDFVTSFQVVPNATPAKLTRTEIRQNPYNRSHLRLIFDDELLGNATYQPQAELVGAGPDGMFDTADDTHPAFDLFFDKTRQSNVDVYSRGVLDPDTYRFEIELIDLAGHAVSVSEVFHGLDLRVSGDAVRGIDETFQVDVSDGDYLVYVGLGDSFENLDRMQVFVEDIDLGEHATRAGIATELVIGTSVLNGLTVRVRDNGGDRFGIQSLRVVSSDGSTEKLFDFGSPTSDVHPRFQGVNPSTLYSLDTGFGWLPPTDLETTQIEDQSFCGTWSGNGFWDTASVLNHGLSVVDMNIQPGRHVSERISTLEVRFSGQVDASTLADTLSLRYSSGAAFFDADDTVLTIGANGVSWDASGLTATYVLPVELANGYYLVQLRSGDGGVADLCGRQLDGEFLDGAIEGLPRHDIWQDRPSGDGIEGGDYTAFFSYAPESQSLAAAVDNDQIVESGGVTNVTITRSGPTGWPLTVKVGSDAAELSAPAEVTIPAGSSSLTFPVTAIDDQRLDGSTTSAVVVVAKAPEFAPAGVSVIVHDNEFLSLAVDATNLREGGAATTATISRSNLEDLRDELVVTLSNSNATAVAVPAEVTIAANQDSASFQISPVDDDLVDGIQTAVLTATAAGFQPAIGQLTVANDDIAGFVVSESDGGTIIDESGSEDQFQVRLAARPSSDVEVRIVSEGGEGLTISPTTLHFSAGNWDSPQPVVVTATDDDVVDGDAIAAAVLSVVEERSAPEFAAATAQVEVIVQDDDTAAFTVTESDDTTVSAENGTSDSLFVVLDKGPQSEVTINITSQDEGEVSASPSQLTFTSENWRQRQEVIITAVDDFIADGTRLTEITFSVDSDASDDAFDAVDDRVVSVTTSDDDSAGVSVVETDGATIVSEAGTTDLFNVSLTAQPTSDVEVAIQSADPGEATVAPAVLVFAPATWNVPQTVTLTGQPDLEDDGTQKLEVTVSVARTNDQAFAAVAETTVGVTVENQIVSDFIVDVLEGEVRVIAAGTLQTLASKPLSGGEFNIRTGDSDDMIRVEFLAAAPLDVSMDTAAGNDVITMGQWELAALDGGAGFDTLLLAGVDRLLDFQQVADAGLRNIEVIDADGSGGNTLHLSYDDLRRVFASDDILLSIFYGRDDAVSFAAGWNVQPPEFENEQVVHVLRQGSVELRIRSGNFLQNPLTKEDVDRSGFISALDALQIINWIGANGVGPVTAPTSDQTLYAYYDVSGDLSVSALDALRVINALGRERQGDVNSELAPIDLPDEALLDRPQEVPGLPDSRIGKARLAAVGADAAGAAIRDEALRQWIEQRRDGESESAIGDLKLLSERCF